MISLEKNIENRILDLVKEIEYMIEENEQLKLQNRELLQALKKYRECAKQKGCQIE